MIADKTLQTLEFPKILARLEDHASFSAGKQAALALKPAATLGKIHAIERFENGRVWGVSDPRCEGAAIAE